MRAVASSTGEDMPETTSGSVEALERRRRRDLTRELWVIGSKRGTFVRTEDTTRICWVPVAPATSTSFLLVQTPIR